LTKEAVDRVLKPKVEGAIVLSDLLVNVNMDFFVLFSSMSSVTSPRGLSDYSAANWFLDAFAGYSNSRTKTHTLTINWPGWKEAGMLADLEVLPNSEKLKEAELKKAILTQDGLNAFARALNSDIQQVIVSPEDLINCLYESGQAQGNVSDSGGGVNAGNAGSVDIGGSVEVDRPTNEIETVVSRIWTDVFGHDHIGIHQQFSQLGGHSLLAMQIVAKARSAYQIDLSLRDFFAAPSIAEFSARIEEKVILEIENLSEAEAQRLVRTSKDAGAS
jgi:acyl carrier protein